MPTLTLKKIPGKLHARLKASAERNRRSLNSEILVRLEVDRDESLPEVLRPLFWDYPFADLRWSAHRDFVIARVLQSGGTDAIVWLRNAVADVELAEWIRQRNGRGLDARQLRFWQVALNLPAVDVDRWVRLSREGAWEGRTRR